MVFFYKKIFVIIFVICMSTSVLSRGGEAVSASIAELIRMQSNKVFNFFHVDRTVLSSDNSLISNGLLFRARMVSYDSSRSLEYNRYSITRFLVKHELRKLNFPSKDINTIVPSILKRIIENNIYRIEKVFVRTERIFNYILTNYGHKMLSDIIKSAGYCGGFEDSLKLFTGKNANDFLSSKRGELYLKRNNTLNSSVSNSGRALEVIKESLKVNIIIYPDKTVVHWTDVAGGNTNKIEFFLLQIDSVLILNSIDKIVEFKGNWGHRKVTFRYNLSDKKINYVYLN